MIGVVVIHFNVGDVDKNIFVGGKAVDELLRSFAYLLNIFFRYAFLAVHKIIGKLVNARNSFGSDLLVDR